MRSTAFMRWKENVLMSCLIRVYGCRPTVRREQRGSEGLSADASVPQTGPVLSLTFLQPDMPNRITASPRGTSRELEAVQPDDVDLLGILGPLPEATGIKSLRQDEGRRAQSQ